MTRDEIQNEINQCENILLQHDYARLKMGVEAAEAVKSLAEKLKVEISMPVYEKYKDMEAEAKQLRARIDELREMKPDDEAE